MEAMYRCHGIDPALCYSNRGGSLELSQHSLVKCFCYFPLDFMTDDNRPTCIQ